jgi:hypothetical protein
LTSDLYTTTAKYDGPPTSRGRTTDTMALPSTYALQQSLPNRSLSARARPVSLAEYQPLSFNREALESAYQQTLSLPASSSTSAFTNPSYLSSNGNTSNTSASPLPPNLKRGDFPQSPILEEPAPDYAGIRAGYSPTSPTSPYAQHGKGQNADSVPPALPPRPEQVPPSTFLPEGNGEAMDVDGDGNISDVASVGSLSISANRKGKRRALPPVPTNVPVPVCDVHLLHGNNADIQTGASAMGVR